MENCPSNRVQMASLEVLGKKYPLVLGVNTIGRNLKTIVNINNVHISQNHAIVIIVDENQHFISDMGSSNGTQLDEEKLIALQLYKLKNGSKIKFGNLSAVYSMESLNISSMEASSEVFSQDFYCSNTQYCDFVVPKVPEKENRNDSVVDDQATQVVDFQEMATQVVDYSNLQDAPTQAVDFEKLDKLEALSEVEIVMDGMGDLSKSFAEPMVEEHNKSDSGMVNNSSRCEMTGDDSLFIGNSCGVPLVQQVEDSVLDSNLSSSPIGVRKIKTWIIDTDSETDCSDDGMPQAPNINESDVVIPCSQNLGDTLRQTDDSFRLGLSEISEGCAEESSKANLIVQKESSLVVEESRKVELRHRDGTHSQPTCKPVNERISNRRHSSSSINASNREILFNDVSPEKVLLSNFGSSPILSTEIQLDSDRIDKSCDNDDLIIVENSIENIEIRDSTEESTTNTNFMQPEKTINDSDSKDFVEPTTQKLPQEGEDISYTQIYSLATQKTVEDPIEEEKEQEHILEDDEVYLEPTQKIVFSPKRKQSLQLKPLVEIENPTEAEELKTLKDSMQSEKSLNDSDSKEVSEPTTTEKLPQEFEDMSYTQIYSKKTDDDPMEEEKEQGHISEVDEVHLEPTQKIVFSPKRKSSLRLKPVIEDFEKLSDEVLVRQDDDVIEEPVVSMTLGAVLEEPTDEMDVPNEDNFNIKVFKEVLSESEASLKNQNDEIAVDGEAEKITNRLVTPAQKIEEINEPSTSTNYNNNILTNDVLKLPKKSLSRKSKTLKPEKSMKLTTRMSLRFAKEDLSEEKSDHDSGNEGDKNDRKSSSIKISEKPSTNNATHNNVQLETLKEELLGNESHENKDIVVNLTQMAEQTAMSSNDEETIESSIIEETTRRIRRNDTLICRSFALLEAKSSKTRKRTDTTYLGDITLNVPKNRKSMALALAPETPDLPPPPVVKRGRPRISKQTNISMTDSRRSTRTRKLSPPPEVPSVRPSRKTKENNKSVILTSKLLEETIVENDESISTIKSSLSAESTSKESIVKPPSKRKASVNTRKKNETLDVDKTISGNKRQNSTIREVPAKRTRLVVSTEENLTVTPERVRRVKPKVVFTMLDSPMLESMIKQLGGSIVDSIATATVLVTSSLRRSLKLLSAVGMGKPICSTNWISDSKKCNEFLDPWDYILKDEEAEAKWNFSLKDAIRRATTNKLFTDFKFHLMVKETADVLKGAIEASDGKCLARLVIKGAPQMYLIVATKKDKAKYSKLVTANPGLRVVEPEAILEGVLVQQLRFNKYLLMS